MDFSSEKISRQKARSSLNFYPTHHNRFTVFATLAKNVTSSLRQKSTFNLESTNQSTPIWKSRQFALSVIRQRNALDSVAAFFFLLAQIKSCSSLSQYLSNQKLYFYKCISHIIRHTQKTAIRKWTMQCCCCYLCEDVVVVVANHKRLVKDEIDMK